MLKKFVAKTENNALILTNQSNKCFCDCTVLLRNIFTHSTVLAKDTFFPNDTKVYPFSHTIFNEAWKTKELKLYIISPTEEIIFEETLNKEYKEECFVLFSNDKYEDITRELVEGLVRYSNRQILHYTFNYKTNMKYPNLENIPLYINNKKITFEPQVITFIKPHVLCDCLRLGVDSAVFLDSDIQVKSNVDSIFDLVPKDRKTIVLQKSHWDCTVVRGMYIPGPLVKSFFQLPDRQFSPHGVTNLIIFHKDNLDLFEEWKSICLSDEIEQIRQKEFLHDELLLNCLLWKKEIVYNLMYKALNVNSLKDVRFFYNFNERKKDEFINLNDYDLGHVAQSFIPLLKKDVVVFHCIKDPKIAKQINDIVYQEEVLKDSTEKFFKTKLISFYNEMDKCPNRIIKDKPKTVSSPSFNFFFVEGAFFEITGGSDEEFYVEFIDKKTNDRIHQDTIKSNHWIKTFKSYFIDWKIKVSVRDKVIFEYDLNLKDRRVYIALDSKSLGDTLAWFSYVDEFRKKHQCKMICSTFWNEFFIKNYPEIEFVNPGVSVPNIFAMYKLGCFTPDDRNLSPYPWNEVSLQKVANDLLGLDFKEVRPRITLKNSGKSTDGKFICIATESTALCKYWNYPDGWKKLAKWFNDKKYKVINVSLNPKYIDGIIDGKVKDIHDVGVYLKNCQFFVGLPSGVAWLAWVLNKKVVMISGFSYPWCEFSDKISVLPSKDVCQGCFNQSGVIFDKSWEYCPHHKDFICTKSITPEMVIETIEQSEKLNELFN